MGFHRFCCLIHSAPYHNTRGEEALDFILAASTLMENVTVIFIDDGVWQLLSHQHPDAIQWKPYTAGFSALTEFGITQIYIEQESLTNRQLSLQDLFLCPKVLSRQAMKQQLQQHDAIFQF